MMDKRYAQSAGSMLLAMAAVTAQAHEGQHVFSSVMMDRLEVRNANAGNSSYWEGQSWIGGDLDKLWLKSQGEVKQGKAQTADAQLLYSRAVAPFWDLQAGMRHDFGLLGMPSRDYAAVALKGLAPYKFDVDASLYYGHGAAAARLKSGYTLLFTQRLSLLPELEANWYSANDPARGVGAGLSSVDAGLRLRYEVSREIAPYIGVVWANKYGATASYARSNGERVSDVLYTAGVRLWW